MPDITQSVAVFSPNGKNRYWINYCNGKVNYLTIESVSSCDRAKFHIREDTGDLDQLIELLIQARDQMRAES